MILLLGDVAHRSIVERLIRRDRERRVRGFSSVQTLRRQASSRRRLYVQALVTERVDYNVDHSRLACKKPSHFQLHQNANKL